MKKWVVFMLACAMMMCSCAMAEMGVQIIGGGDFLSGLGVSAVSLQEDAQLNVPVEIADFGMLTVTDAKFVEEYFQYKKGKTTVEGNWNGYYSGVEADFIFLQANILNTTSAAKNYLMNCEVKVVFDDDFEFTGIAYQNNWNNEPKGRDWDELNGIQNKAFVIDPADQFTIDPWYEGHYTFVCKAPNAVVTRKAPLRMVITIDGNEFTYTLR